VPIDLEWRGQAVTEDLAEPFYQANELLGREFTKQITRRDWDWPVGESPRDIVNLGQLRDSYQMDRERDAGGIYCDHTWPVQHALPVHSTAPAVYAGDPPSDWRVTGLEARVDLVPSIQQVPAYTTARPVLTHTVRLVSHGTPTTMQQAVERLLSRWPTASASAQNENVPLGILAQYTLTVPA